MASDTYCLACGYPNTAARGACLMCYCRVKGLDGGQGCPSCGSDNPKAASFCMACQAAIEDGAMPLQRPDVSGLMAGAVAGGVAADAGEYADDVDFGVPGAADSDLDFDVPAPPGDAEFADEFPAPPSPVPDSADMGDMMGDEFAMDTTGEVVAPPPPDTAFDLGTDTGTAGPDTAGFDLGEGAAPPPPDSVSLDLDDVEAPAPDADDDLGEWSLDYEE